MNGISTEYKVMHGRQLTKQFTEKNQEVWRKPEQGQVRIKTSSSVKNTDQIGAIGILAKDETGRITNGWAVTMEGSFTLVAADLEAIRCALILAQQQGLKES